MRYITYYDSPFCEFTLESDGEHLCGVWFPGHYAFTGDEVKKEVPVLKETREWLDIYFSGRDPGPLPDIFLYTTPFRKRVCEIMMGIPYGEVMSYGEIADIIARERGIEKMSAQAVGGAVGHNPVSILIPCHRVIGKNGELTGYDGGLDIKEGLLRLEGSYTG